jgi:hypothetical protein
MYRPYVGQHLNATETKLTLTIEPRAAIASMAL